MTTPTQKRETVRLIVNGVKSELEAQSLYSVLLSCICTCTITAIIAIVTITSITATFDMVGPQLHACFSARLHNDDSNKKNEPSVVRSTQNKTADGVTLRRSYSVGRSLARFWSRRCAKIRTAHCCNRRQC